MAAMGTINGKPNPDVVQELVNALKSIPKDIRPEDVIGLAKEYLDQIIGFWNWSFEISGIQVMQSEDKVSCILAGNLSVTDDLGKRVTRSAIGKGTFPDANKSISMQSAADIALSQAYASCINDFMPKDNRNPRARPSNQKPANTETIKEVKLFRVSVKTKFSAMKKGGAKCQVQEDDSRVELIIWPDDWEKLHKQFPKEFAIGNKLNYLHFMGSLQEFKGKEQFIFHALPKRQANG